MPWLHRLRDGTPVTREEASRRLHHTKGITMPQRETMGIVPDSGLARLLARLPRPERRLLLATVQAAPGPRRDKLERQVRKRLAALGIGNA